jgi:CHASE2 domain-containing sensor protein
VVVQAQMVSQILSAVQDQRPLIYPVPLTQLLFWSFAWGVLGGFLGGWRSRYRLLLLGGGLVALWVGSGWWLILGNWVPLAMPTITFFGSAIAIAQLNSFKFMPNQSNTGNSL